jgi:hypothetical protein
MSIELVINWLIFPSSKSYKEWKEWVFGFKSHQTIQEEEN